MPAIFSQVKICINYSSFSSKYLLYQTGLDLNLEGMKEKIFESPWKCCVWLALDAVVYMYVHM